MAPRLRLMALIAAVFVLLGVCAARSLPSREDTQAVSLPTFTPVHEAVDLWTRRVHGSDSDSDSDFDSDSDSTSSSTTSTSTNSDRDMDRSSSSSTSDTCLKTKNVTRTIENDDGYGSYYSSGIGSEDSTAGGSTPDGSGTAPRFDNSTEAFVALADDEAANEVEKDDQHYLNYLGGSAIPFKSGEDSPNGVVPKRLENLAFSTVDEDSVKDGSCAVPNTSYAYAYTSEYSLGSAGNVPIYCLCDPYGLCGCDDHHKNSSFVDAMLSYAGLGNEAKNVSSICTVTLDGETTILVNGGLSNGSTKADPDADEVLARQPRTNTRKCGAGGGGTGAAAAVSVNGLLLVVLALGASVVFV